MAKRSIRTLTTAELPHAARLVGGTMLGSVADDVVNAWAAMFEDKVTHGAVSPDGDVVGIAAWFPTQLSLAGPSVPAAGVTAVAVLPTHRRKGHLTRLMKTQLDSISAAEVPIALLVAAEWPIYGRFGYGPAIDACGYELDATTARFIAPRSGTIELVTNPELRPHLEAVHDLRWARTMGAVTRIGEVWDRIAGVESWPGDKSDPGQRRGAIWRNATGEVQGAVAYSVDDAWTRNRPTGKIEVNHLVGATPEAERELWRHLCETDWVSTVTAGNRSVDDPLPLWLEDGRAAAQIDRFDCIWARILDLPRVFAARRSSHEGGAVVEVVDDLGYAGGRWAIELGPDGGSAKSAKKAADVRLPVAALGAAFLGGTPVARLHEAGWLDEEKPGGVARLATLLRTPTAPWSPTTY
jgi:predicted acetyltransferase